jgi:transcriptional regulator with XRE-family HTH domain
MNTNILKIREQKGITQEELVRKSGVSRTTIYLLESGRSIVTTNITMQKIAEALGESVSAVFFDTLV